MDRSVFEASCHVPLTSVFLIQLFQTYTLNRLSILDFGAIITILVSSIDINNYCLCQKHVVDYYNRAVALYNGNVLSNNAIAKQRSDFC